MIFEIHHYLHFADDSRFDEMLTLLRAIKAQGAKLIMTLDEVLAKVTAETSKLDSIKTLIDGLKQQLADALSGASLPPAVQAKVDEIFNVAQTNADKIDAALAANVPPTP